MGWGKTKFPNLMPPLPPPPPTKCLFDANSLKF